MLLTILHRLRFALPAAGAAALVLVAVGGAANGGNFILGQANTATATTSLSGNPGANPLLRVTGSGTAATLRADAGSGIAINGISTSGTGQSGQSTSGYGLSGFHVGATGSSSGVYGQSASTDPGSAGVTGRNTAGGPGLQAIVTGNTVAPLKVNSSARVVNLNADLLDGINSTGFWQLGGNAGTTPGTNYIGTTDNKALELKVNGQRALRIEPNSTSPNLIGGFSGNSVDAGHLGSVVAGGGAAGNANHVENDYDFIGAGFGNQVGTVSAGGASAVVAGTGNVASGGSAFIGAGGANHATADYASVVAGQFNTASGPQSTVGGGFSNGASGNFSAVAGGTDNGASAFYSAVAGGSFNTASGGGSIVAGGVGNTASDTYSAVAGGYSNTAGGVYSAVAGGEYNTASGFASFAAGRDAKATQDGSFVWGDDTFTDLTSPAPNTFTVRASGGIWLGTTSSPVINPVHFIDTSTLAYLTSTGIWTDNSDRALKHDFRPLNTQTVLDKVARMPITSWSYKAEQPSIRHIGPMAQDFYSTFGLGLDDKHIATIDEGGVALAAIQGLYRQNKALERENRTLRAQLGRSSPRTERRGAQGSG
jgi:trimeric autotransporter adhesin